MTLIDITRSPQLILAPGIHVLRRGRGAVQCGVDATRGVVIEVGQAARVAETLRDLHRPMPQHVLHSRLIDNGLEPHLVSDFIEELRGYGIINTHNSRTVLVVGSTPFAGLVRKHLADKGFSVRSPLIGESASKAFMALSSQAPVLLIDTFGLPAGTSAFLAQNVDQLFSATVIDDRAYIGPFRFGGNGPCPMCTDLTATDRDPAFSSIARQFMGLRTHRQDPTVMHAAASTIGVMLGGLMGLRRPHGEQHLPPAVGEMKILEPYAHRLSTHFLDPHPRCPICYESQNSAQAIAVQQLDKAA